MEPSIRPVFDMKDEFPELKRLEFPGIKPLDKSFEASFAPPRLNLDSSFELPHLLTVTPGSSIAPGLTRDEKSGVQSTEPLGLLSARPPLNFSPLELPKLSSSSSSASQSVAPANNEPELTPRTPFRDESGIERDKRIRFLRESQHKLHHEFEMAAQRRGHAEPDNEHSNERLTTNKVAARMFRKGQRRDLRDQHEPTDPLPDQRPQHRTLDEPPSFTQVPDGFGNAPRASSEGQQNRYPVQLEALDLGTGFTSQAQPQPQPPLPHPHQPQSSHSSSQMQTKVPTKGLGTPVAWNPIWYQQLARVLNEYCGRSVDPRRLPGPVYEAFPDIPPADLKLRVAALLRWSARRTRIDPAYVQAKNGPHIRPHKRPVTHGGTHGGTHGSTHGAVAATRSPIPSIDYRRLFLRRPH